MFRITARLLVLVPFFVGACDDPGATTDTVGGQCPSSCDDDEKCTDDRCSNGQCVHVPRNVQEACRQDAHCDDGDPCTTDSCGLDEECGLERCVHEQLPSCRSCPVFDGQCDDFNECTLETCGADKICRTETLDYCDARCNSFNYSWPSQVFVGQASVRGTPWPQGGASCADGCTCDKDVALSDGTDFAMLRLALDDDASCTVTSCDPAFTCEPLRAQRFYIVYGDASSPSTPQSAPARSPDAGSGAAPFPEDVSEPPSPATLLDVQGWCLALESQGIDGSYDATLVVDGESQAISYRITITSMTPMVDGTQARIATTGASAWSDQGVWLRHQFWLDGREVIAHLFPGRDRLQGPVFDPSQSADSADSAGAPRDPANPGMEPDVPSPPRPEDGKRVGFVTWVLR